MANDKKILGKKAKAVPVKKPEIGIETDSNTLYDLLDAAEQGNVDIGKLQSFNSAAQTREYVYSYIDSMALDDRVSSVIDVYASDATETNDDGKVVWCESVNPEISKTIGYLLDSINVDKHAYEWMYSFIKYGDIYLKTFKVDDLEHQEREKREDNGRLVEDVSAVVHEKNEHYAHYVEMVANPCEMFDLTEHDKTVLYVQAPTNVQTAINQQSPIYTYLSYKMNQSDVTIYDAKDFVHASLINGNSIRDPEEVSIFNDVDESGDKTEERKYVVRKGQSFLYNLFKVWRQTSLIEDSLIVNRASRSSLVRAIMVEIGDMPANKVAPYLRRLKTNIEQKAALSLNMGMQEYNNPGPVENTMFIPTHNGQGALTTLNIGGDYDPKQLTDLDYFINKFYGSVGIPKQYFSFTDDGAGFNGGSSLAIISSRYGKNVKKFQNAFCQLLTDLMNLYLLDMGLDNYIGRFTIRMQSPLTQEEIDKRENQRNKIGVVSDIMNQVGQLVDDDIVKLKVLKELLSQSLSDTSVVDTLQKYIDDKELAIEQEEIEEPEKEREPAPRNIDVDVDVEPRETPTIEPPEFDLGEPEEPTEDSYLPSASELGLDLVGNQ